MSEGPPELDIERIERLAANFFMLGKVTRLYALIICLYEPTRVSDLVAKTGVEQSLVSHHLGQLRASELVTATRIGTEVFYTTKEGPLRDLLIHAIDIYLPSVDGRKDEASI